MLHSAKEHINIAKEQQAETTISFSVLISVYKKEKAEYYKNSTKNVLFGEDITFFCYTKM